MNARQTVLILGARAPVTLDLARSFGKQGWRVILADSLRFPVSRWSKYVHAFGYLPAPVDNPSGFKLRLQELIKTYSVNLCIPTCEEAFHVSLIKDELETEVFVDVFSKMDMLHNKWIFAQKATSHFTVPETIRIPEFRDWANSKDYVFKPIYSRFGAETILDKEEAAVKARIEKPSSWIAQRKVQGKEVCVYSIWKVGRLQAFCLYHPKYRYQSGAGIYFEPTWNPKIFEAVKNYGADLCFTGQLSFDFILEEETPYVLECNPRTTSGLHLFDSSIVDGFIGESPALLSENPRAKTLKFPLLFSNPLLLFRKDFWKSRDVLFDWADPLPFFMQLVLVLELAFISVKKGVSLTESMTRDIAYNGHEDSVL